ncbi:carboxymuconolactone decarboxylase family protein [Wenzhouxiangella sp. AB-CW3]|uniref:carboxymuconolactone decarboxylase family protein n=1 Tax=Wenzhouxiangella sp. AB-CW3 TaxID=2771012 RepID=UPI00168ADF0A|nr:carboxymuconolactone decarboxylase family protein [Wenzhouxiangella sp. AB-CW3]QOC21305.1 carboxymuconolactone decarboxylase family protein [Wenzhouxiangella sp. AB-CW3]
MNIDHIKQRIPDYARDLRINIGNVLDPERSEGLSAEQIYATAVATARASRNPGLIAAIESEASKHLDDAWLNAARAAAAIMGMNNIYYRFVHLASNDEYGKLPARLRMSVIGNPGIDKADFELMSLAVSAINGCGMCIDSHERVLKQAGVSSEAIQHSVRIASVLHAVAAVMDAEQAVDMEAAA